MRDLRGLCQWLSYHEPNRELTQTGESFGPPQGMKCGAQASGGWTSESGGCWLSLGHMYMKVGRSAAGVHTRQGRQAKGIVHLPLDLGSECLMCGDR